MFNWLRAYRQARQEKAKEAKYLCASMYRVNTKGLRWYCG